MGKLSKLTIIAFIFIIFYLFEIDIHSGISHGEYNSDLNFSMVNYIDNLKMNNQVLRINDPNSYQIKENYMKIMLKNSKIREYKTLDIIWNEISKYEHKDLLLAIIIVESYINPNAKSDKNAMGLMQVRPYYNIRDKNGRKVKIDVWENELLRMGIITRTEDLYDIRKNIKSGNYILVKYIQKYGSIEKALLKYVGGDDTYPISVIQTLGSIVINTYRIDTEKYLIAKN